MEVVEEQTWVAKALGEFASECYHVAMECSKERRKKATDDAACFERNCRNVPHLSEGKKV